MFTHMCRTVKVISRILLAFPVVVFVTAFAVKFPKWREYDRQHQQLLRQIDEVRRRGEDPESLLPVMTYCGPTPIQFATMLGFYALVPVVPFLPFLVAAARGSGERRID
jgi:hypothetical protein